MSRDIERDVEDLFNKVDKITKGQKYTIDNIDTKRSLDGNNISSTATAYVLGTLIRDLIKQGIIK